MHALRSSGWSLEAPPVAMPTSGPQRVDWPLQIILSLPRRSKIFNWTERSSWVGGGEEIDFLSGRVLGVGIGNERTGVLLRDEEALWD
jgi:hypothetical protein